MRKKEGNRAKEKKKIYRYSKLGLSHIDGRPEIRHHECSSDRNSASFLINITIKLVHHFVPLGDFSSTAEQCLPFFRQKPILDTDLRIFWAQRVMH